MLTLGPVGEGARREQCRKWLAFLDAAHLAWWNVERRKKSIRVARERVEDGERPPMVLDQACHEGMRQLALEYPYVLWGPGPWDAAPERRRVGFWPQRRRMARARARGILGEWCRSFPVEEAWRVLVVPRQRYWLFVSERRYQVHELDGTGIWVMCGKWSHEGAENVHMHATGSRSTKVEDGRKSRV